MMRDRMATVLRAIVKPLIKAAFTFGIIAGRVAVIQWAIGHCFDRHVPFWYLYVLIVFTLPTGETRRTP